MANQIPISGASQAAGGYLLPTEQGDILINGLLQESGALQICGDSRATTARKSQFGIWLGAPTAGFVGEGADKPVTGAEFGQTTMNVKKVASIVLFTDEMIEDVQSGDLNPLVDSGVRLAIQDVIDANIIGKDSGVNITSNFDSMLRSTTATVEYTQANQDALARAVSAAMGVLEANGYGDSGQMGLLLGFGFGQALRDARSAADATAPLYGAGGQGLDPTYGVQAAYSTNLNKPADAAAATNVVGFVVHKPNLHVRIRKDVTLTTSTEATVYDGAADRSLFQENLTAVRYETRLGFMVHDVNRAVVAIINAA
jgi:predicted phage gp36 major capsid-like protein